MAGEYQIAPMVDGYGSPGASALFGVQQEMLRRQQVQQEAEIRQAALARQQQQDALHQQQVEQEIAASKSNVASNEDVRKANAERAAAATLQAGTKQVTSALSPGQAVTPEQRTAAEKLIGPSQAALLFAKTPAVAAQPGGQHYEGEPDQPEVPEGDKYLGTDEQRTSEERKAQAQAIVNGEHDTGDDNIDAIEHARAQHYLNTGKEASSSDLASILKGREKPTAAESKGQRDADVEKVFYDRAIASGLSPADATVKARTDYNHLSGQEATNRMAITVNAADRRQNTTLTNGTAQHEADVVQKKIDGLKLPQAANILETLNSPGGVNDVIAVPEFLSAMAGGVGRGLRMSQAELNMIQNARPTTETLAVKLQNIAGSYTALTPQQRTDMSRLIKAVATRESKLNDLYILTQAKVNNAASPEEARKHVNAMNAQESSLYKDLIATQGAGGTSKYKVTVE